MVRSGCAVKPFAPFARRRDMETLTHLFGTGDAATLAFAVGSLAVGVLTTIVAIRTRPRRRLR